jgi:hypothetical protein
MKQKTKPTKRKNKLLKCYLTQEAYDVLNEDYKASAMRSWSAYLRRRLTGKGMVVQQPEALLQRLDTLGVAMARMGANINQMTKIAHLLEKEGKLTEATIGNFTVELAEYHRMLAQVSSVYDRLMDSFER